MGIKNAFDARLRTDPAFSRNWVTVRDWNETARYNHSTSETVARAMFLAVTDPSVGVLTWVRTQY